MSAAVVEDPRSERIQTILADLIRQRRRLEAGEAEPGLLAANRLGIAYWQSQLWRRRAGRPAPPPLS